MKKILKASALAAMLAMGSLTPFIDTSQAQDATWQQQIAQALGKTGPQPATSIVSACRARISKQRSTVSSSSPVSPWAGGSPLHRWAAAALSWATWC
jgi:hypothetical protein